MTELAEGARLEIVCTPKRGTEGSNPSLSVIVFDSRVLRNEILRTPSDPEGSSGSKSFRVTQGNLAIVKKTIGYPT